LKSVDLREKTAMAETLIGVQQTAAFSLSATSPCTRKYTRETHLHRSDRSATVKATSVQTAAFGVKWNYTRALRRRLRTCLGTAVWGTFLRTHGAFFARRFQKTEGKREKATVSLTVVFFNESQWPTTW
jgi:hypothetical protein